jgi:DNA-binding PadR family transcriptional regulator
MKYSNLAEVGILGVLNERGASPLGEVQDVLQHNFGHYYGFSYGVVMPTVRELEKRGDVVSSSGTDGEYSYHITDSGRERLQELLLDALTDNEAADVSNHQYVLVHLGFLHHLPERDRTAALASLKEALRERREKWLEVERTHADADVGTNTGCRRDIFRLNTRIIEVLLEWLQEIEVRTLDTATASETASEST